MTDERKTAFPFAEGSEIQLELLNRTNAINVTLVAFDNKGLVASNDIMGKLWVPWSAVARISGR
jgi:hypothetical protein